jgi:hypothetical protein
LVFTAFLRPCRGDADNQEKCFKSRGVGQMKKTVLVVIAMFVLCAAPAVFAQDHGELGVYADYVRLHHADNANFWGLGGRAGFNVHPHVQLEAEVSYDFSQSFTNTFTNGGTVTVSRANLHLLHGLFGPKIQTGGPIRVFAVLKGGFLSFSGGGAAATFGNAGSQFATVPGGDTNGVFYPGGGVEFYAGPIGLRFEVGDLMYFDRGANNNLRITFGPTIRF